MEMWFIFAGIAVFVGGAAVYLVFMIFFPEWVGITGETALKAEESHRGDVRDATKVEVSLASQSVSQGGPSEDLHAAKGTDFK